MFEVGKKYRYGESGLVAECKMITEGKHRCAVVVYDDGSIDGVSEAEQDDWTEYKEPVTITRYAVVYMPSVGNVPKIVCNDFETEFLASSQIHPTHKILAIIPVTYTEENGD